ncbi:MAG: flagellar assembly protein FliW [Planctomycetes bacterium]|nr:flagellar assembly protein FliW [Planctomycetota bacterium]
MSQAEETLVQEIRRVREGLLKSSEVEAAGKESRPAIRFSTLRFGEVEIAADKVIRFPWGLIGFGEAQRFVMIDHPTGGPFVWLQAVDCPNLAFVIADPADFFDNYQVPVTPEELQSLRLKEVKDGLVLVVVAVQREPRMLTANLQGPILVNPDERIGRQLVLQVPGYTTRHPISIEKRSGKEAGGPEC